MTQVHYQGVAITITSGGYHGEAKLAIYKSLKNSKR